MKLETYGLILVFIILFAQATWMFNDASKRGEHKWLWGFFGLIHCPSSLIIYLLVTRRINRQITCPHCLYSIKKDSKYCAYCGHEITEEDRIVGFNNRKETEQKNK